MISMQELLGNIRLEDQSQEIQDNLQLLIEKINIVRQVWGRPMTVTSGLRTVEDHLRIYRKKAAKEGRPFDESKVPMKSRHLFGQAVDISDPSRELQAWCKVNESFLASTQLWMEDFSATSNWVHFQVIPYGSWVEGKSLWFMP